MPSRDDGSTPDLGSIMYNEAVSYVSDIAAGTKSAGDAADEIIKGATAAAGAALTAAVPVLGAALAILTPLLVDWITSLLPGRQVVWARALLQKMAGYDSYEYEKLDARAVWRTRLKDRDQRYAWMIAVEDALLGLIRQQEPWLHAISLGAWFAGYDERLIKELQDEHNRSRSGEASRKASDRILKLARSRGSADEDVAKARRRAAIVVIKHMAV